MNRDLTKGSVLKSMLLFSIPMILRRIFLRFLITIEHLITLQLLVSGDWENLRLLIWSSLSWKIRQITK